MAAPAEMVVTGPDGAVTKHRLGDRPTVVGRHPECEIVLTDPMSSRRHCKIERNAGGNYVVEDLKSANGTLINNETLKPSAPVPLRNGDTIQIGSTTLVLRLEVAARTAPPPPPAVKVDDDDMGAVSLVINLEKNKLISEEEEKSSDIATVKRVAERLKLLIDVSQALSGSLDLVKLLNTCLDKLFEVFPQADRGLVLLYGPDGSVSTTLATEQELSSTLTQRKTGTALQKTRSASAAGQELKLSRTVLNRVKSERAAVLIEKSGSMSLVDISSVMCAPLLVGKDDLGLLYIETKKIQQAFNKDDVDVMAAVAGQIALVIRNSDLAREYAQQAAHRENLSRFLSPQLVDQMLKGKLSVELGGTDRVGTIFFSDLVGFTRMAGKMNAHDVVSLLNRYFTVMQNIIFRRGGSIDKCAGDEIMAHWGVVGDMPDFTASAVTAAVEMQIALFAFNRDEAEKKEIVLPPSPLGHGIGLNTGVVCAGNIGSDRKIEFTVIGDTVNKGSRIAHVPGRGQTFIGEQTYTELKDRVFCYRMPDMPFKNVEKPLQVYSVRGIVPPPVDGTSPAPKAEKSIDDLLLTLPCTLSNGDLSVSAMVVRMIRNVGGGARLILQAERPVPVNTTMKLTWNLLEKPTFPGFDVEIDRSWQPADSKPKWPMEITSLTSAPTDVSGSGSMKGGTAIVAQALTHGAIVATAKSVPPEVLAIKPGELIESDIKSHEDIVRA